MGQAEWGVDATTMSDVDVAMMMVSYTRRKKFEAKLLSAEIWTMLGDAMASPATANDSPRGDNITMSADQLLREIGMMDR